jgi:hypothetical protein
VEYGTINQEDMFHSFNLTEEHYFHASNISVCGECENHTIGRMSRALSYTKRGSVLAQELRRVRLLTLEHEEKRKSGEETDSLTDEEFVHQITSEPSNLLQHRRRVSALVGDFVLRDSPMKNRAQQLEFERQEFSANSTLLKANSEASPDLALPSSPAVQSGAPRIQKPTRAVVSRFSTISKKVNALRPTVKAVEQLTSLMEQDCAVPAVKFLPPISLKSSISTWTSKKEDAGSVSGISKVVSLDPSNFMEDSSLLVSVKKTASKYRLSTLSTSLGSAPLASTPTNLDSSGKPSVAKTPKPVRNSLVQKHPPIDTYRPPDEAELFKIVTDHVLRHQSGLVRTIPDKGVHGKLQEIMRIRQERQEMNDQTLENPSAAGIFYRLPLLEMENGGLGPTVNVSKTSAFDLLLGAEVRPASPTTSGDKTD